MNELLELLESAEELSHAAGKVIASANLEEFSKTINKLGICLVKYDKKRKKYERSIKKS